MTTLRRRLLATSTATFAAFALGACGTNFGAQTNQQYQAAEGANLRGEIDVMNAVLVIDENGSAVLSASVVSQVDQADAITDVTITGPNGSLPVVRKARNVLQVPAQGAVALGSTADTAYTVADAGDIAGLYVTVTITYRSAKASTIETPVVERSATYDSVVEG